MPCSSFPLFNIFGIISNIKVEGTAFPDIKGKGKLFPSVGMKKPGEHVRVNFGQRPFLYEIDGMILVSKIFFILSLFLRNSKGVGSFAPRVQNGTIDR